MSVIRYPRPKGLTQVSKRYNEEPNKANRAKLNKLVIALYLGNELLYPYPIESSFLMPHKEPKANKKQRNKSTISNHSQQPTKTKELINTKQNPTHNPIKYQLRIIEYKELSIGLGISGSKLEKLISRYLSTEAKSKLDSVSMHKFEAISRGQIFGNFLGQLNQALSHKGWVEELKTASREAGYRPSLVKEANTALGTLQTITMNTHNMAQTLMKMAQGLNESMQNPTNIQNNYYGTLPNGEEGSQAIDEAGYLLSPTKALQLLEQKGLLELPNETEHEALKAEYLTDDVPSTQALPSDAQGIQRKELVLVSDTPTHEERREEGLDSLNAIDIEAEEVND